MSISLKRMLAGYIAVALALGLCVVYALLYWVFTRNTELMVRDGLYGQAEEIAEELRVNADGSVSLQMHEPMQWAYDAFFANLKYRVLDQDGTLLLASDSGDTALLPPETLELDDAPAFFRIKGTEGESLHVATFPFNKAGRTFLIQTARSDRFSELAAEAMMPAVFETAAVLALSAFFIFIIALLLAVRAAVHRVLQISRLADAINPENIEARLDAENAPAEIQPLVDGFNRALDRIADGYRVQQRFIANAAHELKTPLAILRSRIELEAVTPLRDRLLADVDFMARSFQQMLHLSEVQDLRNYRFAQVDLRDLAAEVRTSFDGYHRARDVSIAIKVDGRQTAIVADRGALFTALRNLVENAIHWTRPHSTVTIVVTLYGFVVLDQGPGLDESHRHLLFEPFWRAGSSAAEGSGLGLSIVAEIARAHGGGVSAVNREDQQGACFELRLR